MISFLTHCAFHTGRAILGQRNFIQNGMVVLLALLIAPHLAGGTKSPGNNSKQEIQAVLDSQITAWNQGDLEGFMTGYWRSPELVYISNDKIIRGWQTMLDFYKERLSSGGKQMGQLALFDQQMDALGKDSVLVWGKFTITVPAGKSRGGLYTVIMRKLPEGWRIVHDRTSSVELQ